MKGMDSMKIFIKIILGILSVVFMSSLLCAQGRSYEGPDDPASDLVFMREGWMDGNRILLLFQNTTELSGWPRNDASLWPQTATGNKMNDGVGLLVGSRVYLDSREENKYEIEPGTGIYQYQVLDDPVIISTTPEMYLDTVYFMGCSYREEQDREPTGTVEWRLYPVGTYFNPTGSNNSESPGISDDPNTWPLEGWPIDNGNIGYQGLWAGRFGWGQIYADLECYFVANDALDMEYTPINPQAEHYYFPRGSFKVGPENQTYPGKYWGGMGIRVQQRGFQWNNPEAQDALFWEYTIVNISQYNLTEMAFGYWVDNAIGGTDGDDDFGNFDKVRDLAYSWDIDDLGATSFTTGTMGFAYLESPGRPFDGIDNDDDGLLDEKRDNEAHVLVDGTGNPHLVDLDKFLTAYRYREADLHEHWDADEDQDWNPYTDTNENGQWDEGEPVNDDVGLDGIAPEELHYPGPDADGTEGNGKPDLNLGSLLSEPNFGMTDVTESDMLGLTAFRMWSIVNPHNEDWFWNDPWMWTQVGTDTLQPFLGATGNIVQIFASSVFPVFKGLAERVSMAEIHSYDYGRNLQPPYELPSLFILKNIVQVIYERDYRFVQPPKTPTLTAVPGDGLVVLLWDDLADTKTREPFLNGENDFEGYRIYRSTDPNMSDVYQITDGFGSPALKKPVFRCDKVDGKMGFAEYGITQKGEIQFLGEETGLTHSWIDRNVQNGRTYYYALVAYDYGIEPEQLTGTTAIRFKEAGIKGISPAENNFTIEVDNLFNPITYSKNVAVVTPGPTSAGYTLASEMNVNMAYAKGDGVITPQIVAKNAVKNGHTYAIKFDCDYHTLDKIANHPHGRAYTTSGFYIYDVTDGEESNGKLVYVDNLEVDTTNSEYRPNYYSILVAHDTSAEVWTMQTSPPGTEGVPTGIFDGLVLNFNLPSANAVYAPQKSGWLDGSAPMIVTLSEHFLRYFPWQYEIVFTSDPAAYTGRSESATAVDGLDGGSITEGEILVGPDYSFNFYVRNASFVAQDLYTMLARDAIRPAEIERYLPMYDWPDGNERMDIAIWDLNSSGAYEQDQDQLLVGVLNNRDRWVGTLFSLDFSGVSGDLPTSGTYRIDFNRPFYYTDSVTFSVNMNEQVSKVVLENALENIKVVPNPYISTNLFEPALPPGLYEYNQRRRLMFTHVPAKCTIKIFTVSGVFIDEIQVDNEPQNGIVHWDMLTREGLELAAGVYLYHVKDHLTGKEKLGKIAILK
jgi:hypothetical protein